MRYNDDEYRGESEYGLDNPLFYLLRRQLVEEVIDSDPYHPLKHRVVTGAIGLKEIIENQKKNIFQIFEKNSIDPK